MDNLEGGLGSSLLRKLSSRKSHQRNNSPHPPGDHEQGASGDDSSAGRLSRRLSRLGSRHHSRDPPRPPVQLERPPAPPVEQDERHSPPALTMPSAPPPAPAPLPFVMDRPPKRPDKSTKPKFPPRPLSKVFSSDEHGSAVLQGFDTFRGDKTLCDVVLISGDSTEVFPVHRVIMASSSDYFKAMFTGLSCEYQPSKAVVLGQNRKG
ncbi:hypothetical protein CHARACLAT_024041, partial [Characodon lateralis]|nr:hypothetical protein [Characodon lateralis]